MRCPVCNHKIWAQPSFVIKRSPQDYYGNYLFLWDQVYLSDSDDDDIESYVIGILSEDSVRILITADGSSWIQVEDIASNQVHKLREHKKYYTNWRLPK